MLVFKKIAEKYFNSSFHREILESFIKDNANEIRGEVLEVGSKDCRYRALFKNVDRVIATDIIPDYEKGIKYADIRSLPYENETFDAVIAFEVMEYFMETQTALNEVRRVLKSGGVFYFSVPFICPVHGNAKVESEDTDFVRYTSKAWSVLLDPIFTQVEVYSFGGRWSIMYDFFLSWVRFKTGRLIKLLLLPLISVIKPVARYLDSLDSEESLRFAMGYFIICRK